MNSPTHLPKGRMPQLDLVITRPPDTMILHPELGLFKSPWEAIEQLGKNYAYLAGEVIGLQWQTPDGTPIKDSEFWSKCFFVPASYYPKDHTFEYMLKPPNGNPSVHVATLHAVAEADRNEPMGNINEWTEAIWRASDEYMIG